MDNFNKQRFQQVAKWDLTINKNFYRNLATVTLTGVVAITVLGFFMRWMTYKTLYTDDALLAFGGTMIAISYFTGIMMIVFAGCINHPLRNKQGRITTLTLPATNQEKFVWHTLCMIGGGFLFCWLCILIADGVNALLTFMVFPVENVHSMTLQFIKILFGTSDKEVTGVIAEVMIPLEEGGIKSCVVIWAWCEAILYISIFAFGNALKYKNNIILTIIAIAILQFMLTMLFFTCVILFSETLAENFERWIEYIKEKFIVTDDMLVIFFNWIVIIGGVVLLCLSALLWTKSYKLYCRAQITSKLNKN